jgi:signal transduction histidine kinase
MRSIALKLSLAFLFVSVLGVALAVVFVRLRTEQAFDRFVLDRYQLDLLDDLAAYYRETGSWDGLEIRIGPMPSRRMGHGVDGMMAPLALVDAEGEVIYGSGSYRTGQTLARRELQRAVPITVDGQEVGQLLFADGRTMMMAAPDSPESAFLGNLSEAAVLGALGAVAVALLVGTWLARNIARPVREVTEATRLVADGELGYQVPVRTKDELGELAVSFNQMSADLARANVLRRQMTADIAHDLRNPLSVILGTLEALHAGRLAPTDETVAVMYERARHLQHLVDDLRLIALADAGELPLVTRAVEPAMLLEHTAIAHMAQAQAQGVVIRVQAGEALPPVEADPDRINQVLGNLVSNALRYTAAGGEIALTARREGNRLLLSVSDTGSGIAAEDLPHIFDRFYRGDSSRQHNGESGLGLAIARSIAEAHGGNIVVDSVLGRGTVFTVALPLAKSSDE